LTFLLLAGAQRQLTRHNIQSNSYIRSTELKHTAHGLGFAAGFSLALAVLNAVGVLAAAGLWQLRRDFVARIAGGGIVTTSNDFILGV
jgi:hydrogenase/urease accessory protein HupE